MKCNASNVRWRKWWEKNRDKRARYTSMWRKLNPDKAHNADVRNKNKRQSLIREAKSVPCPDCGGMFPPCCMDFDHVRGEKKFNISVNMYSRSFAALLEEIAKCDVVCANCHRIRTERRRALIGSDKFIDAPPRYTEVQV